MKPIIVSVDIAGFNYSEERFDDDFIKRHQLNPIQVCKIRCGQEVHHNGATILRINYVSLS